MSPIIQRNKSMLEFKVHLWNVCALDVFCWRESQTVELKLLCSLCSTCSFSGLLSFMTKGRFASRVSNSYSAQYIMLAPSALKSSSTSCFSICPTPFVFTLQSLRHIFKKYVYTCIYLYFLYYYIQIPWTDVVVQRNGSSGILLLLRFHWTP